MAAVSDELIAVAEVSVQQCVALVQDGDRSVVESMRQLAFARLGGE
ncbi:hypothetical protein GFS60_06570 (plasmid) [Rhodococcus sp. WAY2]|nr:hypothetical protein GFS60_06570 [Rhodococcus sp. WAY2]